MSRRDYRKREPKKSRKGAKKTKPLSEILSQPEVEVVKKRKEASEEEE